jgi:hypothetical protein
MFSLISSSWSFVSMMLLIASRLVFTFPDVGENVKNGIGILLAVFLILILVRTVVMLLIKRVRSGKSFVLSSSMFEDLTQQEKAEVCQVVLEFLTRKRTVEINREYALNSSAQRVFEKMFPEETNKSIALTTAGIPSPRRQFRVTSVSSQ